MPKVIYLGGYSRSGTTLLDRMLGELPGVVTTGELGYLTTHGIEQHRLCGCGKSFRDCPFWSKVAEQAFFGWDSPEAAELRQLYRSVNRHRYIPLMLFPRLWPYYHRPLMRYAELLGRLFVAIAEVSGADAIVDSTVDPSRAFVLRLVPGIEVIPVQMIRDSRGVAYSWTKKQRQLDAASETVPVDTFNPIVTAFRWVIYHLLFELFQTLCGRRTRVNYCEVVKNPEAEIRKIAEAAHLPGLPTPLPFIDSTSVVLTSAHGIAGNNMKMTSGKLALRSDDEWRKKLPRRYRIAVTAITGPLLRCYNK